ALGLPDAIVQPPWVEAAPRPSGEGEGFVLGGPLEPEHGVLTVFQAWQRAASGQPLLLLGRGSLEPRLIGARRVDAPDAAARARVFAGARALIFYAREDEPFG